MIDYRIKTFLTVTKQGTLLKASDKLGLTQPAVSQHIKSLEQEYSVPLFNHEGRRLVLNDAGKLLRTYAAQAESLFSQFRREAAVMKGGKSQYRLGATLTIGEFILPAWLGRYRADNPGMELSILIENTVNILGLLDSGEIDLALVEGPFDHSRYNHRLFMEDEMIFLGGSNYRDDEYRSLTPEEFGSGHHRLILREQGSGTRHYWEQYCREKGLVIPPASIAMEVGSLTAIKSLVEAGMGCSVMSRRAAERELSLGTLFTRPFSTGPLIRPLYLVYRDRVNHEFLDEFMGYSI